jgi:tetratricopeptide (TPR) repeat protein
MRRAADPCRMIPTAFVAMPTGTRPRADGEPIDFDRIRCELLGPALAAAGYAEFRAGDAARADRLQELLVADLVVVDLTVDIPIVWYELGVRHALRARGVALVQGPRPSDPFDVGGDRALVYRLRNGAPDPAWVAEDVRRLTEAFVATREASAARPWSPVYRLLPRLREPGWRNLLLAEPNQFADAQRQRAGRMAVARESGRPGDILVLADEAPTQASWLEAKCLAADALLERREHGFALEQYEAALALDPDSKPCREKRSLCLARLGRFEEARESTAALTRDHPSEPEGWALAGLAEQARWVARWRSDGASSAQMRHAARLDVAMLDEAIAPYRRAFVTDPSHHESAIGALMLERLRVHLEGGAPGASDLGDLAGGARWSALAARQRDPQDYRACASVAGLALLLQAKADVMREYAATAAAAKGDWFALDSTKQTLALLRDLEFRPAETAAALEVVDRGIAGLVRPFVPRQVLLFSGHMVDAPRRAAPRFPQHKVAAATGRVARALDELDAGAGDVALAQGAAGGDLIFAEACAARGVRVQLLLPLAEPDFVEQSILRSADGAAWRDRVHTLEARLQDAPRVAPDELGPVPERVDVWERCNLWLLYTALAYGPEKVGAVVLWDGGGGDGPGGTRHMVEQVTRCSGRVTWIDTRTL